MSKRPRIGLIGLGYLGHYVYDQISTRPELGIDIGFVHDGDSDRLADIPEALVLSDLANYEERGVDLVAELAHPDVTRQHGLTFVKTQDYLPLSLTAFADEGREDEMREAALSAGTRIFMPHGGTIGLDALEEGRELWEEVSIVMRKPVRSLDFARAPQFDPATMDTETTLFEGVARDICPMFPRNVNTHAGIALAGIGFDRTRSVLIADPSIEVSIIDLKASGGGVEFSVHRVNPMAGVSGKLTLMSVLSSVGHAAGQPPGMWVC